MEVVITKQQERKYVEGSGVRCINCESYNITVGEIQLDVTGVFGAVHCNECGYDWWDVYKLVGATERI